MSSEVKRYYVSMAGNLVCLKEMTPEYAAETGFAGLVKGEDYAALEAENARLRAGLESIRKEQAITRRVIDRIGQLCTAPHESKERFIRRVQSVIEWERAAQQDQPQ